MVTKISKFLMKGKGITLDSPNESEAVGASLTAEIEATRKTVPGASMEVAHARKSAMLEENEQLKKEKETLALELNSNVKLNQELHEEINELHEELVIRTDEVRIVKDHWDGVTPMKKLDPNLIDRSDIANRHLSNFDGEEFFSLRKEIEEAGGNTQPIKVRPTAGGRYEIVFGHRRHEACRQLGLKVNAVIDELNDQDTFIEMERENRNRKDLSAWEQGAMYQRAIDKGLFPSQKKMAEAIGLDQGNISKAISISLLPEVLVRAFNSPIDIQFRWGKELASAFNSSPQSVSKCANELASMVEKPKAKEIFEALVKAGSGDLDHSDTAAGLEIEATKDSTKLASIGQTKTGRVVVKFDVPLTNDQRIKLKEFIESLV